MIFFALFNFFHIFTKKCKELCNLAIHLHVYAVCLDLL